jgi:hypothetical protein
MRRVIVFGVGGVGSHLSYLLTRANTEYKQMNRLPETSDANLIDELVLVDFDEVEQKNTKRQMFFRYFNDIELDFNGEGKKCIQMANLLEFEQGRNADGTIVIKAIDKKITDEMDLAEFDRDNDFAFICTDNMQSKLLLFRYFEKRVMVSCDKDYYEIKTKLDRGDNSVFEFGGENGAYNSAQTFSANVVSAMHLYRLFLNYGFNFPDIIIREQVDSRLDCENRKVIWNPTPKKSEKKGEVAKESGEDEYYGPEVAWADMQDVSGEEAN